MGDYVATPEIVKDYFQLFVNRRAYTVQSRRPHRESGRHYYYRPKDLNAGKDLPLTSKTITGHLEGKITIGLYAINPTTQRCKWVAIDADYENSLEHLLKLQWELKNDHIEAALEKSRRGGHLWILARTPLLARHCRIYIYNLALRLKLPVKGAGLPEGIEMFPRHDALKPEEFGNAIRGPLGIHQANQKRYFFYGADYTLQAQMDYLKQLPKISEGRMTSLVANLTIPEQFLPHNGSVACFTNYHHDGEAFRILDHVRPRRTSGRNYWAQCPSCALEGHDRSGDNLAIAVNEPHKYKCWAGCTREMIREALSCPVKAYSFH
jgi:hypothetical protein